MIFVHLGHFSTVECYESRSFPFVALDAANRTLVGVARIELATSSSRTKRATAALHPALSSRMMKDNTRKITPMAYFVSPELRSSSLCPQVPLFKCSDESLALDSRAARCRSKAKARILIAAKCLRTRLQLQFLLVPPTWDQDSTQSGWH